MGKKTKLGLVIAGLALVLAAVAVSAVLGFFLPQEELKRQFPMWEIAAVQEDAGDGQLDMRLVGMFYETSGTREQPFDSLWIQVENSGSWEVVSSVDFQIEFLFRGIWYTVYRPEEGPDYDQRIEPRATTKVSFSVPSGLLEPEGEYRLSMDGLGFCGLDVIFQKEEFAEWYESEPEQEQNSDVQMTLAGIDYDVANGDNPYDEIQITLKNNGDEEFYYEDGYEIQYDYQDRWYTIKRGSGLLASFTVLKPGEEKEEFYTLPHGFLAKEGKFRVYQESVGYCELTEK